jgi:hypothetical protein
MRRILETALRGARRMRGHVLALALLGAALVVLAAAATAGASPWEKFKNCPVHHPKVEVTACLYGQTVANTEKWVVPQGKSEFTAGNTHVPLKKPIIIQGGETTEYIFASQFLTNPEDGAPTLVPARQVVPGGLKAAVDASKLSGAALEAFNTISKNKETNKLYAVVETAPSLNPTIFVSPEQILAGEGIGIDLPLKVKFINAFLGESCYAGSDAEPINMELTSGTTSPPPPNEPISGHPGQIQGFYHGKFGGIAEDSLVNNSFAAPAVTGCGAEPAWQEEVDAAINSKVGLPAPAGTNTTRINGFFLLVGSFAVERELGL